MKAASVAGIVAVPDGFEVLPGASMSLSVASNAAGYGKPLGYGVAGLSAVSLVADALQQRSSAASSWSWTPPSTGSGHRDARLSNLMAVVVRFSIHDPDGAAPGRSGQGTGVEFALPPSGSPAQSDAADLLQALDDNGAASAVAAPLSPGEGSPELDRRPVQDPAQRASTAVTPVGSSTRDPTGDPSVSAADAQLEALFKTLQAYGL